MMFQRSVIKLQFEYTADLPLRSDYPIVPSQLREAHVEPLLAALALDRAVALDRPSPHALRSRRICTHD